MTYARVFLSLTSAHNWHLYQLDLNTALLGDDLNEEVYIEFPPGLTVTEPTLVGKLFKSLSGLKQASR